MPSTKNLILARALGLAARDIPVFPCRSNKIPCCPTGFKAATTDAGTVVRLWREYPGPLVGVPTGSASDIDVLDVDPRHNGDAWLDKNLERIPPTSTHETRSGGFHLLFRHVDGIRNSAGKIAPGVDVRGEGGYVIWWPAEGLEIIDDHKIAPWPNWLLIQIRSNVTNILPQSDTKGRTYAKNALRSAVERIAAAQEGTRNNELNREAWKLARFLATGDLTPRELCEHLAIAAKTAGLSDEEITRTLLSAITKRRAV
jgi:hypothetical protein